MLCIWGKNMYFPRQRQEEKLLLELCSQLLVVWKKPPALTVFWLLKRVLPDPNLTGFGRFCTSQSNGFTHKWNGNCSPLGALYGDCQVSKGLTDASTCSLLSWTVLIAAVSNKHHSFKYKPWNFHKWPTSSSCSFERLLTKPREETDENTSELLKATFMLSYLPYML